MVLQTLPPPSVFESEESHVKSVSPDWETVLPAKLFPFEVERYTPYVFKVRLLPETVAVPDSPSTMAAVALLAM